MKIDAPSFEVIGVTAYWTRSPCPENGKYRAVRESDWRKIMAVVKAADGFVVDTNEDGCIGYGDTDIIALGDAAIALRKHLAKRKADAATADHSSEVQK